MATSQSSTSNSTSNAQRFRLPKCGCGLTMRMYTSNTGQNPNRRYWKCPNFMNEEISCKFFRWDDELCPTDFVPRCDTVIPQILNPVAAPPEPTASSPCNGCMYADKLMEAGNKKIEKLQLKLAKERSRVHGLVIGLIITLLLFMVHAIVVHFI